MEKFHLLIADQDAATADEWPHYEEAIAESRERFHTLLEEQFPADLICDGITADTLLDGFIGFCRHSIAEGFFLHPLICTTDELVLLKLAANDTAVFPHGFADSQAIGFPEIRRLIKAAHLIHQWDCRREALRQILIELHDLLGVETMEQCERLREELWRRFNGGEAA